MTVLIFLIVLAVLIFVHEFGHFVLARANGIRVDEFKIGFGPEIFGWVRGETRYGLNLIPFGGYVKIFGENPDDESMNGPDSKRSFVNKNRWRQASVLVAGVFFNFLFAWLLYIAIFTIGVTATSEGFEKYAQYQTNPRVMIENVQSGSPAESAGLKMGDTIKSISTLNKSDPSVEEVQKAISESSGVPFTIGYVRNNALQTAEVTATTTLIQGKYAIGVSMQKVADLQLPFFTSIYEGAKYTVLMIRETAVGLYMFIAGIFTGTANFAAVSGPVGIAGIVGNAAQQGMTFLFMITAIISINLGVINLIPFPALDGGRTLMVALEGISRRRIPAKFANAVNAVGFLLLMILMLVVTYKDITKLIF